MHNAIRVLDLLVSALSVKNAIEESDLKFMAILKNAMAEGRDISDEEVKQAEENYLAAYSKWEALKDS